MSSTYAIEKDAIAKKNLRSNVEGAEAEVQAEDNLFWSRELKSGSTSTGSSKTSTISLATGNYNDCGSICSSDKDCTGYCTVCLPKTLNGTVKYCFDS